MALLWAINGFKLVSMSFLSYSEDQCGEFEIERLYFLCRIDGSSAGLFFDLIECLIQRDFGYNTNDVRVAYKKIKPALLDPSITKVVVVAHSQGGIVLSMALDNLLADLPRECNPFAFRRL